MRRPLYASLAFLIIVLFPLCTAPALGQGPALPSALQETQAEPAVAPAVPPADVPAVTADREIFKRTPVIDGVIKDGEWDIYYTTGSGGTEMTTYADWDDDNLYLAAKSAVPADLMVMLDANNDGWYHGEDNYELKIMRGEGDARTLTVSLYESKNAKTPTPSVVSQEAAGAVEMKSAKTADGYMCEMRIPAALCRGFRLGAGRKVGLRMAFNTSADDSGWTPAGDVEECTLVTRKIAALKPLELGFDLRDTKIARGEELIGRFHLTNTGNEIVDVRTFVIAGEGRSGEYLSSQKIRMEGITRNRHIAHDVKSIIPSDMPLGSWAIGAEVRSKDARLGGVLMSFDVVEPVELALKVPDKPVRTDVKDVTFGVVINNNKRGSIRGKVTITLPTGWELWRNADTRDFSASGKSISTVAFRAKPPLGALGEVPVKVDITVDGMSKTAEEKFEMVNP